MVDINFSDIGTRLEILAEKIKFDCKVVEKPFYDPKKKIASI